MVASVRVGVDEYYILEEKERLTAALASARFVWRYCFVYVFEYPPFFSASPEFTPVSNSSTQHLP